MLPPQRIFTKHLIKSGLTLLVTGCLFSHSGHVVLVKFNASKQRQINPVHKLNININKNMDPIYIDSIIFKD